MYTQQLTGLGGFPPTPQTFSQPIDIGSAYVTPPLGRVFEVLGDGTTVTNLDDSYSALSTNMERRRFPSIALALAEGKASRGDVIIVGPGHTETVTATSIGSALVAGVQIIGLGQGSTRPTLNFAVAGATITVAAAGVTFRNLRFIMDYTAATTVTAGLTVNAEGCVIQDCYFHLGTSNSQKCATMLTVSAANCQFINNVARADTQATALTAVIALGTASTGADGFVCVGNRMRGATGAAATGLIKNITSTATSDDILIAANYLHQWKSDSSACISLAGDMVTTGLIKDNVFRVMNNASLQGITFAGTGVDVSQDNNKIINNVNETAIQNQGTVSA